jgi:fatty acid desaturase
MAERIGNLQDLAMDLSMGTAQLPGRDVLDRATLRALNIRSDRRGAGHFLGHCLTILVTAGLVHALRGELVLLGQPLPRAILLAEHTGCSTNANGLTNTRTTLTSWPIRFLMWNMPYHAEHHLYPSIPFHALPQAHGQIRARLAHLDIGYIAVNRAIVHRLARPQWE